MYIYRTFLFVSDFCFWTGLVCLFILVSNGSSSAEWLYSTVSLGWW